MKVIWRKHWKKGKIQLVTHLAGAYPSLSSSCQKESSTQFIWSLELFASSLQVLLKPSMCFLNLSTLCTLITLVLAVIFYQCYNIRCMAFHRLGIKMWILVGSSLLSVDSKWATCVWHTQGVGFVVVPHLTIVVCFGSFWAIISINIIMFRLFCYCVQIGCFGFC